MPQRRIDCVIIGGGFYGCCIALYLKQFVEDVVILEKEADILTRASYVNQARVHNGYHYPRSFMTALRSRENFPKFITDFSPAIDSSFTKIYAVAKKQSKINAQQFRKFCEKIGAEIAPASATIKSIFDFNHIEQVFEVKEFAFNAEALRELLKKRLHEQGIEVRYETEAKKIKSAADNEIEIELISGEIVRAKKVLNCSYSQINVLLESSGLPCLPFKHELTEMALIDLPAELKNLGITIMDGPFFSVMPFPAQGLHTLSHVRYTPQYSWTDQIDFQNGHALLKAFPKQSNITFMLKDAARYIPTLAKASYVDSLFEVKTTLIQNELDDGRPILFRQDYGLKNLSVVMGGKIDNIYDILEAFKQSGNFGL